MTSVQLPHELQLHTFGYLKNNFAALCALVLVCKQVSECAFVVLRICRTLDLSNGFTDEIEPVLLNLLSLAVSSGYDGTASSLRDNVIRHAFRFATLRLNFNGRYGRQCEDLIDSENMAKLENMWKALASIDRFDIRTWRVNMMERCANTSIRMVLRTMLHLTTLELSGSTNVLHWQTEGILDHLRTLKSTAITNNRLSAICCRLATKRQLGTLEFTDMAITTSFLELLKHPLSITSLQFHSCWVSLSAMRRILRHCRGLQTIVYTINAIKWPAEATFRRDHHLRLLVEEELKKHANTLKHLTLVMLNIPKHIFQCRHVVSLTAFTSLEILVISYHTLASHESTCVVDIPNAHWKIKYGQTAFNILSSAAPSLRELHLHRADTLPVMQSLARIVINMGAHLLPNLQYVEVTLAKPSIASAFRSKSVREEAIIEMFGRRGVICKIWRPQFLFDGGSIVRPR